MVDCSDRVLSTEPAFPPWINTVLVCASCSHPADFCQFVKGSCICVHEGYRSVVVLCVVLSRLVFISGQSTLLNMSLELLSSPFYFLETVVSKCCEFFKYLVEFCSGSNGAWGFLFGEFLNYDFNFLNSYGGI